MALSGSAQSARTTKGSPSLVTPAKRGLSSRMPAPSRASSSGVKSSERSPRSRALRKIAATSASAASGSATFIQATSRE